jgi:hypothetical protein
MSARANCRMCTRVQSNSITHLGRIGNKTSKKQQIQYLRTLKENAVNNPTVQSVFYNLLLEYGVVLEQNSLFDLQYSDPHSDSPKEILHTIALGVCKYSVLSIMKYIKDLDKIQHYHILACIAARIDSLDQSDSRDTLSPKSVIEHVAAHVCRDCKLFMRYGVFIFRDVILTEGQLNTMGKFLCASAKVTRHAYCSKIQNLEDYNRHFCRLLDEWCLAYNDHDPSALARKHKPHTLYYIPECVARFGPL